MDTQSQWITQWETSRARGVARYIIAKGAYFCTLGFVVGFGVAAAQRWSSLAAAVLWVAFISLIVAVLVASGMWVANERRYRRATVLRSDQAPPNNRWRGP